MGLSKKRDGRTPLQVQAASKSDAEIDETQIS